MTSGDKNINKSGKFDLRIDSGDKNLIGPKSKIHGKSILGDNSGNIGDNTVLRNSNNTESNNNGRGNKNLISLLQAGNRFSSNNELDCRVNSGNKNIIGAHCEIGGDSIVGDGSGNNTMTKSVVERNNTMKESVADSKKTMNSNKKTQQQQQEKAAAKTVTIESAPTTD